VKDSLEKLLSNAFVNGRPGSPLADQRRADEPPQLRERERRRKEDHAKTTPFFK
jgi:hypothetical protein